MMTSGIHRCPFEGRHIVFPSSLFILFKNLKLSAKTIIGLTIIICSVTFILIHLWEKISLISQNSLYSNKIFFPFLLLD